MTDMTPSQYRRYLESLLHMELVQLCMDLNKERAALSKQCDDSDWEASARRAAVLGIST